MTTSTKTRAELVAEYRTLARSLADERIHESDARALRSAIAKVQAEIDAIDLSNA